MNHRRLASTVLALLAGASGALAQGPSPNRGSTDLEQRLRALEASSRSKDARIAELEGRLGKDGATAQGQDPQGPTRRGIADSGQTSIFDSTFNPAISLIGDFVLSATDQSDNFESQNQFTLRDVELGVVGRVDPLLSYQLYVHFSEGDIELEEAYVLADNWLPGNFSLKAGRFNADFGKLAPVHDHDLPFVDKPQVLQEYLGGSLRGTGLELHHNFSVGEATLLRWSVGVLNDLGGDGHAIFGPSAGHGHDHDEEGAEPFGDRDLENFGFTGRVSALTEVGDDATFQVGASVAHAPEARSFYEVGMATVGLDLKRTVVGVDLTFKSIDPQRGNGFTVGVEGLRSIMEASDDGVTITNTGANGFYGYVEYSHNTRWSFGISGGQFEHAEDSAEDSTDVGVFATHRINEFNRLRLEARQFDDPGEDFYGVMLQWTVILGSHGHGIDW